MSRAAVVAEGRKWIGKLRYSQEVRYDFRENGSADCSSFFQHCMKVGANREVGDWTVPQFANGKAISRSQLQIGDAVFYGMNGGMRHVVLYVGNGLCLSQGGPSKGPVLCSIDYRSDISGYRSYLPDDDPKPSPIGEQDYAFSMGQVARGFSGAHVKLVQRLLSDMGFYKGSIDGDAGDGTISAIKAFQKSKGLAQDGSCGQVTFSALTNLVHNGWQYMIRHVYQGSPHSDSVAVVQRLLNTYACRDQHGNRLKVDGDCGANTVYAIRQFQQMKGLKVDGDAGRKTLRALIGL